MTSSSRDEEMLKGIEELEAEPDARGNAGNIGFFAMHCENFARIAKISLCTIFCYDSEILLS